MKHKDKIKLARKLRTRKEELERRSIFSSKAWSRRKEQIKKKLVKLLKKKK